MKGLDLFTTAVPPSLPLCLTIGLEFALERLKSQEIHCINVSKINEAGRVKFMCFDKTGTLTENSLIFSGFWSTKNDN